MTPTTPTTSALRKDIVDAQPFTIDVLYGDHEGGQRTITRFGMIPQTDGEETAVVPDRRPPLEPGPARPSLGAEVGDRR